jgi:hypothetical protein
MIKLRKLEDMRGIFILFNNQLEIVRIIVELLKSGNQEEESSDNKYCYYCYYYDLWDQPSCKNG